MKHLNNSESKTKYIDSLTGARFLAIMLIVFDHLDFLKEYGTFGRIYWRLWHNATMGVDFFFMMSGFGMMLSSIRRDQSGSTLTCNVRDSLLFAIDHVRKIYPLYVATLLIGIPFKILTGMFIYGSDPIRELLKSIVYFLIDLTLLQSSTGKIKLSISLNPVGWFLSTLFCIYLVSPFIMELLKKHVKNIRTSITGIVICIICSYLLAIVFTTIDKRTWFDNLCYGSPYRRVFYVITGMLLAQVYVQFSEKETIQMPRLFTSGVFEYVSICFSMIWFFWYHQFSETYWVYIVNMLVVACDIFSLAIHKGKISHLFESNIMVYLGKISMYIYLVHYPIRMYVDFILNMTGIGTLETALAEAIIILLLTFIISNRLYQKNGSVR